MNRHQLRAFLPLYLVLAAGSAEAAIFTVDTTSDAADAAINGTCAAAMAPPNCTLRAAIMEANAAVGPHTINFTLGAGPYSIAVGAAGLPAITQQVTIDGYSQVGSAVNTLPVGSNAVLLIELNGTATVGAVNGLTIAAPATVQGLVINRFADYGIRVDAGGAGSVIRGNFVGTNVAGSAASGNNRDGAGIGGGIILFSAGGVTIGGTAPSARNLVSGNTLGCVRGIELWESSGNTIQGNYVGTNAAGTAPIGNGCAGTAFDGNVGGSDGNLIGGGVAGAGNLLSGNGVEGLFAAVLSDNNTIQGNVIGLNAAGTTVLPNGQQGLKIESAGNTVGGDTALERNVISGSGAPGINVNGEAADGNVIEGNYIGTDVTGTLDRGNSATGITVEGGADNTRIGGSSLLGLGNLISGNFNEAIYIRNVSTTGTIVQGNKIGTNAAGTGGIGGSGHGVLTDTSATGTRVGGINPGEGNIIAFNNFTGVGVGSAASTSIILGNSIHDNNQIGIDLGVAGVTVNDALDADAGPNDLLNFPVITGVYAAGASIDVSFSLDVPAGSYRVEFFTNPAGVDPLGNGEGQVFAGFQNITHTGGGPQSFLATVTGTCADQVTATASFCSDLAVCAAFSRTSEFSAVAASGCLAPGQPFVKSGSYAGNATAGRPIYVGFQPDVVFVKNIDPVISVDNLAVIRTSTMIGDLSKSSDNAGQALAANLVQSLTPTGFTVGSAAAVNETGIVHHWVAFKAAPGLLKVGTYPGDGNDNRAVPGVGFQPEFVITLPANNGIPFNALSTAPADTSFDFDSTQLGPNLIQAFQPDGFEVGIDTDVNANGVTYHYIAWNAVPGRVAVGAYFGNGQDNRNLDLAGFFPEWVIVKKFPNGSLERAAMHKPASTGVGTDIGLRFADVSSIANTIQTLRPLGFQVGNDTDRINSATDCGGPCTYHWVAFGPHVPPANYRSIGTAGPHSAGTITATVGSPIVTGVGTGWRTANRGRGDSIIFGAFTGTILSVDSETQLTLTSPSTVGGSPAYTISRKFATLTAWEDCIDGGGTSCGPDPAVPSPSLVADNRNEVGIAYKDSVFLYGGVTPIVTIDGSTTDATHTITLTADPGNRHLGIRGNGVILDMNGGTANDGVQVNDAHVTVEWLEIKNNGAVGSDGIEIGALSQPNQVVVRHNLIHNLTYGIQLQDNDVNLDVFDNIVHDNARNIVLEQVLVGTPVVRIFNNTVFRGGAAGVAGIGVLSAGSYPSVALRNNISHSNAVGDYGVSGRDAASSHNLAGDATGITHSPAGGGIDSVPLTGAPGVGLNLVNTTAGSENLHLLGTSRAVNAGADLSSVFSTDIDGVARLLPWEVGADDVSQTTAVALQSFIATASDAAVELAWRTASELQNLGFHLHRSTSPEGPWTRITSSLIPGLGSSPTGASYAWRDTGLSNGTTYFYELEDVETTGRTERHGPVSATPQPGAGGGTGEDGSGDSGSGSLGPGRITYGDPAASSLREVERGKDYVVLELLTPGFVAVPEVDGAVRVSIPGFVDTALPGQLAVPVRRALVDALAGRRVRLASVSAREVMTFDSFRLSAASAPEVVVTARGVVKTGSSRRPLLESSRGSGLLPRLWARLLPDVFQGETKKAQLELSPLRHDPASGRTLLARRLLVRVEFKDADRSERSLGGSRGRRPPAFVLPRQGVFAHLVARSAGLHRVRFEDLFGLTGRGFQAGNLRLSHLGQAVPYHLEPDRALFAPGSELFFLVRDGASLHDRGEAVYELALGQAASRMAVISGAPTGPAVTEYQHTLTLEQNRFYQSALLQAPDLWLWDLLVSPVTRSYPFTLEGLAPSSASSRLEVVLQGASDFVEMDHHVRLSVNGTPAAETTWDGKVEQVVQADLAAGVLLEGSNTLTLENVGDAGAAYSMVFLNRFAVTHPRRLVPSGGRLEGRFPQSGRAEVQGLSGTAYVLENTAAPTWLHSTEAIPSGLAFRAEADKSYLAVSDSALLAPEVRRTAPTGLRRSSNRAHWVLVGPREFLPAALPLLELRRAQGLLVRSVALEDVHSEFGFGEPGPKALHDFLSFAFHNWRTPPRYVVLLGDSTYDPNDYLKTGVKDRVPTPIVKTTYLWTASDPTLAAVNGEDVLPDLAIGRLSASTLAEAQKLVDKLVAFEQAGRTFDGKAVLVADNADVAGSFEQNQAEIASSVLSGRETQKLYLRDLGASLRPEIMAAFDSGPGIMSYVGHGATAVWASENVWNNTDVAALQPQAQQPLLLTLNCLNGFFHFPPFDSLAEALVKAEGKGALAAFSPSGLSVNDAAHLYHKALLAQIESGQHLRLGDAVLAAQQDYADQGAMPELLAIYHLLGDPGMRIR